MTTKKHLKRRVRSLAAQTGQPYASALRRIRQELQNRMPEDSIASCSFCGKPNTAVERLVAGAGVYICNECVELSAVLVADAAQAAAADRSTEDILAKLPALVRGADQIENELAGWIRQLTARGTQWQVIADAVGMSTDDARRRFDAQDGSEVSRGSPRCGTSRRWLSAGSAPTARSARCGHRQAVRGCCSSGRR